MRKILLTLTICLLSLFNYAQVSLTSELEKAYGEEKYDLIISEHSEKASKYTAKAI